MKNEKYRIEKLEDLVIYGFDSIEDGKLDSENLDWACKVGEYTIIGYGGLILVSQYAEGRIKYAANSVEWLFDGIMPVLLGAGVVNKKLHDEHFAIRKEEKDAIERRGDLELLVKAADRWGFRLTDEQIKKLS